MPGYKGHLFFGLLVGGLALAGAVWLGALAPDPVVLGGLMAALLLGALFPDLDTDSKGRRLFYLAFLALDVWLIMGRRFEEAAYVGILAILPGIGRHRGWTHAWWAMLLVPAPILVLPYLFSFPFAWLSFPNNVATVDALHGQPWKTYLPWYLAFVAGYGSHLLLDRKAK